MFDLKVKAKFVKTQTQKRDMEKSRQEGGELKLFSQARIHLVNGEFDVTIFRKSDASELIVISRGSLKSKPLFVRVHSECFTGEVLGSLRCDCRPQLDAALGEIARLGDGMVIYLRQEGRGIGLGNKIKSYALQNQGHDTVSANEALGFASDLRDFADAAQILRIMGVREIALNTNNPDKISGMKDAGIRIQKVVPSLTPVHDHNRAYLETKYERMGHRFSDLFGESRDGQS